MWEVWADAGKEGGEEMKGGVGRHPGTSPSQNSHFVECGLSASDECPMCRTLQTEVGVCWRCDGVGDRLEGGVGCVL